MDIKVLQYFLAAAKEESITRAAQLLNMTQPPLSRQLKELEEELGKVLFIRGKKKLTLTEDGLILKKRAEEIVELFEKTKSELCRSSDTVSGDIFIGSGETQAVSIIAHAAKELQQLYPDIHYHIYSADGAHVTEKLDKGLFDFGMLVEPFDISKYEYLRLPVSDTWGILMRDDCELAQKVYITPGDLWDKPLIISQQTLGSVKMNEWMKKDISSLNIVGTYNLIYNASLFAQCGYGYVLGLANIISTVENNHLCFRPLYPKLTAELCFVWKKYQRLSKLQEMFLDKIKEACT
ncbi:MAG: LysR family transcriptional regulator [Oscillospiraceae bacterium]|nr:LysR family transcriptional regulator [Oscillospiraceae bacterium]